MKRPMSWEAAAVALAGQFAWAPLPVEATPLNSPQAVVRAGERIRVRVSEGVLLGAFAGCDSAEIRVWVDSETMSERRSFARRQVSWVERSGGIPPPPRQSSAASCAVSGIWLGMLAGAVIGVAASDRNQGWYEGSDGSDGSASAAFGAFLGAGTGMLIGGAAGLIYAGLRPQPPRPDDLWARVRLPDSCGNAAPLSADARSLGLAWEIRW